MNNLSFILFLHGWILIFTCLMSSTNLMGQNELVGSYTSDIRNELKKRTELRKVYPENNINNYELASGYSQLGVIDSAFFFLKIVLDQSDGNDHILFDQCFKNIRGTNEWMNLLNAINRKFIEQNPYADTAVAFQLRSWKYEDQNIRQLTLESINKYGRESGITDSLRTVMKEIDSLNQVNLTKLIDKKDWPTKELVGTTGMETVFFIVQHADYEFQIRYFESIKQSVACGDIPESYLAMLTDRMLLREGKKQLYGTQVEFNDSLGVYELCPVEDEINLNKRRENMGLGSISSYIDSFNFKSNKH